LEVAECKATHPAPVALPIRSSNFLGVPWGAPESLQPHRLSLSQGKPGSCLGEVTTIPEWLSVPGLGHTNSSSSSDESWPHSSLSLLCFFCAGRWYHTQSSSSITTRRLRGGGPSPRAHSSASPSSAPADQSHTALRLNRATWYSVFDWRSLSEAWVGPTSWANPVQFVLLGPLGYTQPLTFPCRPL
jgi:hypothetical protein